MATVPPPLPAPADGAELPLPSRGFTQWLRILGAAALLAAGGSFLVSTWMEASPLLRFYGFLGFTGFLAAAGTFCGVRWREDKGARTFLALATWFVPVCTVQWAGFLHAQLGRPAAPHEIFRTVPIGEPAVLLSAAVLAVTLLPVVFLSFAAMARPQAGRLALAYLAGNIALAQPERSPNIVLGIALALLALLLFLDLRWFSREARLQHRDGWVVRITLFLPLAILVGRNLMLYGQDANLAGFSFCALGAGLFLGVPRSVAHQGLRSFARWSGMATAAVGWILFAGRLHETFGLTEGEGIVPVVVLPFAGVAFLASLLAGRDGRLYRSVAGGVATAMLFIHLSVYGGTWPIVGGLALGVALVAAAFCLSERVHLVTGVLGFGGTLLHVLFSLREFWAQNLWVSLGVLGVGILVASSLLERNWHRLHRGAAMLRDGWQAWE